MNRKLVSIVVCMLLCATPSSVAVTANDDWWPMFHHDPQNSRSSTSPAPGSNNVKWSTQVCDILAVSSPSIVDDKVYVGTWGNFVRGIPCKKDVVTDLQEKMDPSYDYEQFFMQFINGNYLPEPTAWPGLVFCLDGQTGDELWNFTTNGIIVSSPAVYEGKVYIAALDHIDFGGIIYCLDAEDGEHIWQEPIITPLSSPIVVDGLVYIPSAEINLESVYPNLTGQLLCLDADNGDEEWTYDFGLWEGVPGSSPAVADGKVYVPTAELIYDWENPQEPPMIACRIYCLDASNGGDEWIYDYPEWEGAVPCSSPAVVNGRIYIPSIEYIMDMYYPENTTFIGKFLCLDANDGDEEWTHIFGEWEGVPGSSPAVADGMVYIPTVEASIDQYDPYNTYFIGRFYCLNAEDGDEEWTHTFGEWEGVPGSSAAVAHGKIFIPTVEIYIDFDFPENSYFVGKLQCLNTEDGDQEWFYSFGEFEGVPGSSPAIANGAVYVPTMMADIFMGTISAMMYAFEDEAILEIGQLTGGFGIGGIPVKNIGSGETNDFELIVQVEGGIFNLINVSEIIFGQDIPADNETIFKSSPILGLGPINIKITADASNAAKVTKNAKGFLLIILLLIISQ